MSTLHGLLLASLVVTLTACRANRTPKSELVTLLPTTSYDATCAAADEAHVYWTASGHVFRARVTGGDIETFAQTSGDPHGIGVEGPDVTWIDEKAGTLVAKAKTGGEPRVVGDVHVAPTSWCVREDAGALYAAGMPLRELPTAGGRTYQGSVVIVRIDKRSGAVTELARPESKEPQVHLATDATHVYFHLDRPHAIRRIAKGGGAVEVVNTRDPRLDPNETLSAHGADETLAVANGNVYMLSNSTINVVPVTGGAPTTMLAGGSNIVATKNMVCTSGLELRCIDARGKVTFTASTFSAGFAAHGDSLYYFASGGENGLRRVRL